MFDHEWDKESIDFPIGPDSVVFEVGGYEGRWAAEIARRYDPILHVFEPQDWAYKKCADALFPHPKARVMNFALGAMNGTFPMENWGTDGCSFTKVHLGKPTGKGEMREIGAYLSENDIPAIDLMLLNVEGYELFLIPHMLKHGIMDRIRYFMCQFHVDNEVDEGVYWRIRDQLGQKMLVRFNYGKVLTCWEAL